MSTFDRLVEQRRKRGITQRQMAKWLKVPVSTLNRYEKGSRKISIHLVDQYAAELGLKIELMVK